MKAAITTAITTAITKADTAASLEKLQEEIEEQARIAHEWMFASIRANDKLSALMAAVQAHVAAPEAPGAVDRLKEALDLAWGPWTPPESD